MIAPPGHGPRRRQNIRQPSRGSRTPRHPARLVRRTGLTRPPRFAAARSLERGQCASVQSPRRGVGGTDATCRCQAAALSAKATAPVTRPPTRKPAAPCEAAGPAKTPDPVLASGDRSETCLRPPHCTRRVRHTRRTDGSLDVDVRGLHPLAPAPSQDRPSGLRRIEHAQAGWAQTTRSCLPLRPRVAAWGLLWHCTRVAPSPR